MLASQFYYVKDDAVNVAVRPRYKARCHTSVNSIYLFINTHLMKLINVLFCNVAIAAFIQNC